MQQNFQRLLTITAQYLNMSNHPYTLNNLSNLTDAQRKILDELPTLPTLPADQPFIPQTTLTYPKDSQPIGVVTTPTSTPTSTVAEENVLKTVDGTLPLNQNSDQNSDQNSETREREVAMQLARDRLDQLLRAVEQLPRAEQEEFIYVRDRLHYLTAKFGSSAKLAIMAHALLTSVE